MNTIFIYDEKDLLIAEYKSPSPPAVDTKIWLADAVEGEHIYTVKDVVLHVDGKRWYYNVLCRKGWL